MKRIFFIMMFFLANLFANETVFQSVIKNVLLKDTQNAISSAKKLQQNITQENFKIFLKDWKRVEALYLAGEMNYDYIDTPRFIDVFNNLKEDLNSQMRRVVNGTNDVKTALFKNSFKTINALEFVIAQESLNPRSKEIVNEILNSIIANLQGIEDVYKNYLNNPKFTQKEEIAILVNVLVATSYRLKEWRVGNPAGLSAKFKGDIKNERAEYFLTQNSFEAIKSILEAQSDIVNSKDFKNLYTYAKNSGSEIELNEVSNSIKIALDELNKLPKDDFTNASYLFETVSKIHDLYYVTIIEKLGLKPEILDADGD
ncbi:imelysin family protein [Aliarcobacter skirrowii]|uniref:imelysin family protein n=1 Tax=Aliarcobacter skirrowii TaxID=28200 RepID=UPI0021B45FF4|nr:imelysin family protein [Aliarcobacter skirrowii]MCT7447239.1 imelysin [Aliarcobacter skirrowii]